MDEVVTWQIAEGPESATVIDVVDGNYTFSWNRQRADAQRLRPDIE